MTAIPTEYHDLIGAPHFAHLVTVNKDGGPQSSPIWIVRDGDDVLFATDATYRKAKNMARESRVAMTIRDEANPYRYIELRGRAKLEPRGDYDFVDARTQEYMNQPEYPYKSDDAEGLLVRVRVTKASPHNTDDLPLAADHPADVSDLLAAPHFGHIATINPNGSPQSSIVWIKHDGDDVLFWTTAGTRKVRNLVRQPAVSVSSHDVTNPYRYVELRGRAEVEPVGNDWSLLDELTPQYWQADEYPAKSDNVEGVVVRIKPRHQVSVG
jgi:PPOX class probable F420-dependent enzyme